MCHYCGCRQIPLIIDYIAEHDAAVGLGADALAALDRDDLDVARGLVEQMARQLRSHWRGEEDGLFAAMRTDETTGNITRAPSRSVSAPTGIRPIEPTIIGTATSNAC